MFQKTRSSFLGDNTRRHFIKSSFIGGAAALAMGTSGITNAGNIPDGNIDQIKGDQRLSLKKLKRWELLGYGMFIHFGMSTFVGKEMPDGNGDPLLYAPDRLDVDQWVSVAKNAGMKYAILTTKHVAGHCLWPSKCTDYSVTNSTNKTDVVRDFVNACKKYNVLPGFYYCSWDNHHKFGSKTPTDVRWSKTMNSFPRKPGEEAPFTSSMYQSFQTQQLTELLTQYGPVAEVWIDIPGLLGPGYRTFLYQYISGLQPDAVIMMNSGIGDGANYNVDYAWPSDIIAIERSLPPTSGHMKWRKMEGKNYYMPGEVCDPIGKDWFFTIGDKPRSIKELTTQYLNIRARKANFLLDVPPNRHGIISNDYENALMDMKKALCNKNYT